MNLETDAAAIRSMTGTAMQHTSLLRRATTAHLSQVRGPLVPDAPEASEACGIVSGLIAARLLAPESAVGRTPATWDAIQGLRELATGDREDRAVSLRQVARITRAAGLTEHQHSSVEEVIAAARRGDPSIVLGGVGNGHGHIKLVSGVDEAGRFILNDPARVRMPAYATERHIRSFWANNTNAEALTLYTDPADMAARGRFVGAGDAGRAIRLLGDSLHASGWTAAEMGPLFGMEHRDVAMTATAMLRLPSGAPVPHDPARIRGLVATLRGHRIEVANGWGEDAAAQMLESAIRNPDVTPERFGRTLDARTAARVSHELSEVDQESVDWVRRANAAVVA